MISEEADDILMPPLDRAGCDESTLDADQFAWRRDGFVVKRGFLPDDLVDRYVALRSRITRPGGCLKVRRQTGA